MRPGRAKSKERALPHPYPTFYDDVRLGSEAHRNARTRGANISLLSSHFSCPKLRLCSWPPGQPVASPVPSCPPSQATTGNGQTHSDQLIMLPITSSTMRSWRETEKRGLREGEKWKKAQVSRCPPSPGLSTAPRPPPQREERKQRS